MDIKTVFGVVWRQASFFEVAIIILFLALIIGTLVLLKYNQVLRDKKYHDYQLFLFKLKHRGFSNFQIKMINNIIEILQLQKPRLLLENPVYFESAIARFLTFLRKSKEKQDSLMEICKDITVIYEKLYHPSTFKKPLESLEDIDENKLIYFVTDGNHVYLGKIINKSSEFIDLQLFRKIRQLKPLTEATQVQAHIWRIGDAEYTFDTTIIHFKNTVIRIKMPESFNRAKEFHPPYIEVIIPAKISLNKPRPSEGEVTIRGTISKINDYEAVIKVIQKLTYNRLYDLEFELMQFTFKILCEVLAGRTVEEENKLYYTLKFEDMSKPAKQILRKFIYDHL